MRFDVKQLRTNLGLAQPEFGQLFGVHPMTVSRWERKALTPSPYQQALMSEFKKAAVKNKVEEELRSLLVADGVAAAIYFLLKLANMPRRLNSNAHDRKFSLRGPLKKD